MDTHYHAFISYRHHPDDIRAAAEIQRLLEHYPLPRELRRKHSSDIRIFRDKDELPITSNLSEDITRALHNSDYLIVMCSTHTHESAWVQREIQEFLESHERTRVLTVLVDGEPVETIPEILRMEERTDPETGETRRVPVEPLSCDWRLPRRKARVEELPRLMASLLGCGYNELRQRERHFRAQKRLAAACAALGISLCFAGYFLYANFRLSRANDRIEQANIQVQENLDQAMENQSQVLAGFSREALENGDRMLALKLALEALPQAPGQRPYVSDAELALNNALGAYAVQNRIFPTASYDPGTRPAGFHISPDGASVYIEDGFHHVTAWDTDSSRMCGEFQIGELGRIEGVTARGDLIVRGEGRHICYSRDGEVVWSREYPDATAALLENGEELLVCQSVREYDPDRDRSLYGSELFFVDTLTGKDVRPSVRTELTETDHPFHFLLPRYASFRDPLLTQWQRGEDGESGRTELYRFQTDTGEIVPLATDMIYIFKALEDENGDIFLLADLDGSGIGVGTANEITTSREHSRWMLCLDGQTGKLRWKQELTAYFYGYSLLEAIPDSDQLFVCVCNRFLRLNKADGKLLGQCEIMGCPITVRVFGDSAWYLTSEGKAGYYFFDDNHCLDKPEISGRQQMAEVNHGLFAVRDGQTTLSRYNYVCDENRRPFRGDVPERLDSALNWEDRLLLFGEGTLYMYDTAAREPLWQSEEFPGEPLGLSEDGRTLWFCSGEGELAAMDPDTGKSAGISLEDPYDGSPIREKTFFITKDNPCFLKMRYLTGEAVLLEYDRSQGRFLEYPLTPDGELPDIDFLENIEGNEKYQLFWDRTNGQLLELSLEDCRLRRVEGDLSDRPWTADLEDGRLLVSTEEKTEVLLWGEEGSLVLDTGGRSCLSAAAWKGGLLALLQDGSLVQYSEDGDWLAQVRIRVGKTFYKNLLYEGNGENISWNFTEDGYLILRVLDVCSILSCSDWGLTASVEDVLFYDPARDEFIIWAGNKTEEPLGVIPRYHLEEQRKRAQELLGEYTLTEEQLLRFGFMGNEGPGEPGKRGE